MPTGEPIAKQRKMFIQVNMQPIFGTVISRHMVHLGMTKALADMPPPKTKRTAVIPGYSKLPE